MSALMRSQVPCRITFSCRCQVELEGRARASYAASCSRYLIYIHSVHSTSTYIKSLLQKPFHNLPVPGVRLWPMRLHGLLRVCGRSTAPRPQVPRFAPFRRFSEHDYSPSSRLKNDACTGFYGVSDEVTPPVGRAVKHRFSQMSATARNSTNQ